MKAVYHPTALLTNASLLLDDITRRGVPRYTNLIVCSLWSDGPMSPGNLHRRGRGRRTLLIPFFVVLSHLSCSSSQAAYLGSPSCVTEAHTPARQTTLPRFGGSVNVADEVQARSGVVCGSWCASACVYLCATPRDPCSSQLCHSFPRPVRREKGWCEGVNGEMIG